MSTDTNSKEQPSSDMDHSARALQLSEAKDYLWALALAGALVYGFGCLAEFILLNSLGVGSFEVPRERAIAAGMAYFLFVSPIGVYTANAVEGKQMKCGPFLYSLVSAGVVSVILGWLLAVEQGGESWPYMLYVLFLVGFVSLVPISLTTLLRPRGRWRGSIVRLLIIGAGLFSAYFATYVFGLGLLPGLGPTVGGVGHQPVDIFYKGGSSERLLLLTSDDKTIVVTSTPFRARRKVILMFGEPGPIISRISREDIRAIRSVHGVRP